uniref:Developmentally-regulated ectodermal protein n=1 Tax=Tripneustes gratilla TaxID=7673 RepID=ECTP_TRIGR|nr:RecName: Full=Developmentally-regulated ectodermal protein; Flags: Precursor [Tripneustes gratilla]CAA38661.1 protein with M(r)=10,086 daltons [Tripneustes gratilla]
MKRLLVLTLVSAILMAEFLDATDAVTTRRRRRRHLHKGAGKSQMLEEVNMEVKAKNFAQEMEREDGKLHFLGTYNEPVMNNDLFCGL